MTTFAPEFPVGNIIKFPKKHKHIPSILREEMEDEMTKNKMDAAEFLSDNITSDILAGLYNYDICIDNPQDIGMLTETLRSTILRSFNVIHPMQKIADDIISVTDAS